MTRNQNTEGEVDISQVSLIWSLAERQWRSAISSEVEGWGWLLPFNALHLVIGPPDETVGCSWMGATPIPLSARFSTVQIVWKIHEVIKCERYKANSSVWGIWQRICRSDFIVSCKSFFQVKFSSSKRCIIFWPVAIKTTKPRTRCWVSSHHHGKAREEILLLIFDRTRRHYYRSLPWGDGWGYEGQTEEVQPNQLKANV